MVLCGCEHRSAILVCGLPGSAPTDIKWTFNDLTFCLHCAQTDELDNDINSCRLVYNRQQNLNLFLDSPGITAAGGVVKLLQADFGENADLGVGWAFFC